MPCGREGQRRPFTRAEGAGGGLPPPGKEFCGGAKARLHRQPTGAPRSSTSTRRGLLRTVGASSSRCCTGPSMATLPEAVVISLASGTAGAAAAAAGLCLSRASLQRTLRHPWIFKETAGAGRSGGVLRGGRRGALPGAGTVHFTARELAQRGYKLRQENPFTA
ncbi:hypothetical protein cyc_04040 [Cyclospora cayetanensis]|uniref:Uncharacterized protein n=1 Tax=Cyclospora cayetanensis TaxID=88456 RepID=A0A1D3D5Y9_9EIME|nr:hypothetical protein cyc_04040 [Cyclospora cayetanensis]